MIKKYIIDCETNGLNSMNDRITCICLQDINTLSGSSFYDEDESKMLTMFFNAIDSVDELIGFNNLSFDIPFIIRRSLINKIKFPQYWKQIKHTDLRKVVNSFFLSYNNREHGNLNDWSKVLGLGEKETNGLECIEAYNRKDWKFIVEHCENDCKITLALLNRCKECNLI